MTAHEDSGPLDHALATSVDAFLSAKLHCPTSRSDWQRRERLLTRVKRTCDYPVTLVAAPAGYGKTILLAQWLAESRPRAAWVSLDSGDNDPNRLWTHVATALERAGCSLPKQRATPATDAPGATAPASLLTVILGALDDADDVVIVLDDFHFVRSAACHGQVEHLIAHLPTNAHLVIATRSDPGLRLGRLRAAGGLLEIRADDLGFTEAEAEAMLAHEQVTLGADSVSLLVRRTEGWPAGLYLASLSLAGRPDPEAFVHDFSGGNRYIGDYLSEEVLSRHSAEVRDFIHAVSILDRFCADLCDHVTGSTGSATILRELERSNLFLVPLDDDGRWYRFHHLFADVARSELSVTRPELVSSLHARAARWFLGEGNIDEAVKHSIAGGEHEAASLLVQTHWLQYVDVGRIATVVGWLRAIGPVPESGAPAATVMSAWVAALLGDERTLADRLEAMAGSTDHRRLPDGSHSVESAAALINGMFGFGGPLEMMRGAERAQQLETDHYSPFYAIAKVSLGHAAYVMGDLDRALTSLENARHNDRAPNIIRSVGLALEALVHDERGCPERSWECAEGAVQLVESSGLTALPQASLAYTAVGRAHATAGRYEEALTTLERGLAVRRQTSAQGPWGMMHHLVVHARVAAEVGQTDKARELLADLDPRLARFADGMTEMHRRVAAVHHLVRSVEEHDPAGEPLTEREVQVLQLLQGSLSMSEIADQLFVSFNTVKTHSRSVYRKLGVHNRAEAVVAGRRHGVL